MTRLTEDINHDLEVQLLTSFEVVGECFIWTGSTFSNGYGVLKRHLPRAAYHRRAHIAVYQLLYGDTNGMFVCHTCDNKSCVNPDHLWLGTNQDNQLDYSGKGLHNRYWTPERRAAKAIANSGSGNPMYGVSGEKAPCFGRTGSKHPMFGKHHTEEAKAKISSSLLITKRK